MAVALLEYEFSSSSFVIVVIILNGTKTVFSCQTVETKMLRRDWKVTAEQTHAGPTEKEKRVHVSLPTKRSAQRVQTGETGLFTSAQQKQGVKEGLSTPVSGRSHLGTGETH